MATVPPIVYSFRRCPYAMRARLALAAAGQTVELREVILRDKPTAMIAASPKATVPVLVLPDGTVIDESLDIMRWALDRNDPEGWWPDDVGLRAEIDALIAANDGAFKNALDRYKYPDRFESETIDGREQRDVAGAYLVSLDRRLGDGGWLVGGRPSLADYAIVPFVRQFAHVDRSWFDAQSWPNLIARLDRFLVSERFATIMVRHKQWKNGDPVTLFPGPAAERAL
ncbi:glutathione S-transferase [Roseitalea porphyridii]|uniref:Glutathione S-transferase n=1 Tax=Roseitalea porphyridii TaxID=1852022 RepID=A0A4P6UWV4_9HYPH|nr:glutathione S-transferase [Roseitalea porphyridii]QBK29295.1 glutathione S-transferase [Roseitalea porphyridii]